MTDKLENLEIKLPHSCFLCEQSDKKNLISDLLRAYENQLHIKLHSENNFKFEMYKNLSNIDTLFICPGCQAFYHRNCWKLSMSSLSKLSETCSNCNRKVKIKTEKPKGWGIEANLMRGILSISSSLGLLASIIVPGIAFASSGTYYSLAQKYNLPLLPEVYHIQMPNNSNTASNSVVSPDTTSNTTASTPEPVQETQNPISEMNEGIKTALGKWAEIKTNAYLQKDTSQLSSILIEPALSIRIEGISYWQSNSSRNYNSLVINAMEIIKIDSDEDSSAVATVHVTETHETSEGELNVDGNFKYFLKKINNNWYISDIKQVN